MRTALEFMALIVTAIAMAPALAHALEHPGKMRLARDDYLTVQGIYYPGFTLAGAFEPIAVVMLAILLILVPNQTRDFWLIMAALAAAILTQLLYWILTAPVNRIWLKEEKLPASARRFFGMRVGDTDESDWAVLRDRWERSHLYRAFTTTVAFVLLAIAIIF